MTLDDQEPESSPGLNRRGLLRGAAGIGIAGVAAGLLVDATAGPALAAPPPHPKPGPPPKGHPAPPPAPIVAFVQDARSGTVQLFSGDRQVTVHNPQLAAALAKAFATGH